MFKLPVKVTAFTEYLHRNALKELRKPHICLIFVKIRELIIPQVILLLILSVQITNLIILLRQYGRITNGKYEKAFIHFIHAAYKPVLCNSPVKNGRNKI